MLFQSISFIFFLILTFTLYWRLPKLRLWLLAFANALFYLAAGWQNLLLFLGASGATFYLGQLVTANSGRWAMWAGIALNLANLFFFKYATFLTTNLHPVLPFLDPALVKDVLLPIGISFYTFQHISYLVDRRLKELPPAPNYLHFWVYISFFGHSIAGPIMRGHEFFPQIAETTKKVFDASQFRYGLSLFVLGLVKKVVIADRLAWHSDRLFSHPFALTTGETWAAALMFTFQIYYDFSAYSDMAVGIGHMFGYKLTLNFKTPYVAANASEFWDRWHITLSRWIRDYVYIPLGGSRCGEGRQYLNLSIAMLASGFWHGAAWNFLFWGAFHGMLLLAQRLWEKLRMKLGWGLFRGLPYRVIATAAFFVLIVFSWVLFRARSMEDALWMMQRMTDVSALGSLWAVKSFLLAGSALFAIHLLEAWIRDEKRERAAGAWLARLPFPVQGVALAALTLILMTSYKASQDFIYFQF